MTQIELAHHLLRIRKKAAPTASDGRFSPLGPFGMACLR